LPRIGKTVISVPRLHLHPASPSEILKQLVLEYKVPRDLQFPLLMRIRLAKEFAALESRRIRVATQLSAFLVLSRTNHEALSHLLSTEGSFEAEVVELLCANDLTIPNVRDRSFVRSSFSIIHSLTHSLTHSFSCFALVNRN